MDVSLGQIPTYQSSCISLIRRPATKRTVSSSSRTQVSSKAQIKQALARTPPLGSIDKAILITRAFEVTTVSPPLKRTRAMVQRNTRLSVDNPKQTTPTSSIKSRNLRHRRSISRSAQSTHPRTGNNGLGIPALWTADDITFNLNDCVLDSGRKSSPLKTKLPPFRQSRRWTRTYTVSPPAPPPKDDEIEPFPTLSLRETSFEQQRAELRPPANVTPKGVMDNPKDDDVTNEPNCSQNCSRPSSLPCWQAVKVVRILRPNSMPSKWLHRKASSKSKSTRKSREASSRPNLEKTSSSWSLRDKGRGRTRKRADQPDPSTSTEVQKASEELEKIIDLDAIIGEPRLDYKPLSPIPSLHDPKKVAGFSQEWNALLSRNGQLDQSWLVSSSGSTVLPRQSSSAEISKAGPAVPKKDGSSTHLGIKSRHNSFSSSTREPKSNIPTVRVTSAEIVPCSLQAPIPPVRTSSKGGVAKLAGVLNNSRSRSATPSSVRLSSINADQPVSKSSSSSLQSRASRLRRDEIRMPSPHLKIEEPLNSAASTDTFAVIESQCHGSVEASIMRAKKVRATLIVPPTKTIGPVGKPPERPLPDLPAVTETDSDISGDKGGSPHGTPTSRDKRSPIQVKDNTSTLGSKVQSSRPSSRGKLMEPLMLISALEKVTSGKAASNSLSSKTHTPVYSATSSEDDTDAPEQSPPENQSSFIRHDVSHLRPERVRSIKKRIKDDIISDRHRLSSGKQISPSISEVEDLPPLPPLPNEAGLSQRSSLDQLDRFPVAPTSRPGSRASACTIRPLNRARGQSAHQASRGSMIFGQRSIITRTSCQILGHSEIKVLVDTNPITGTFRTGALSPSPGSIKSQTGSPARTLQGVKPVGDDDRSNTKMTPTQKPGNSNIKSNSSSRKTPARLRHPRDKSASNIGLDGLEYDPDLSPAPLKLSGGKKVRRRWNSNDIQMVQMLYNDLEDYHKTLLRQQRELRRQEEEIQMMVRVFAPISRAHGLKQAMFPGETALTCDSPTSPMYSRATQTPRKVRKQTTPVSTPIHYIVGCESESRTQSYASSSTNSGTTNVTRASNDKTPSRSSNTDPFEYDMDLSPTKSVLRAAAIASASPCQTPITATPTLDQSQLDFNPPKSQSPSHQSLNPTTVPTNTGNVLSNIAKPLHKPPPIPSMISRPKFSSDPTTYYNKVSLDKNNSPPVPVLDKAALGLNVGGGVDRLRATKYEEDDKENKRLSVNHVLANAERMDWVLDQSMFFR